MTNVKREGLWREKSFKFSSLGRVNFYLSMSRVLVRRYRGEPLVFS